MGRWTRKLRIGEKIGFGYGIVGLLFLGMIWQYHNTLQQALSDYRQLHDVYGARKTPSMTIESSMLRAQHAEKYFVLSRDETFAQQVHKSLEQAVDAATGRQAVEDAPVSERMGEMINGYGRRFKDVV